MESRKITIISNRDQTNYVIMSSATTLGELKADMDRENIYYTGMSFFEGLTQTELKMDSSLLPTDVPYRGTTTNELLFCLTQTDKKIASGMDRSECYEAIKRNNWNEEVKRVFGKNFTQCSTADLESFIYEKTCETISKVENTKELSREEESDVISNIRLLAKAVVAIIDRKSTNEIREELTKTFGIKTSKKLKSSYSEEEIENILGFIR